MDADARKQKTKKTNRPKTSDTLHGNVRFEKAGARSDQTEQTPLEKCANERAGASPRCMGALVVAEMLASEAFGAHAGTGAGQAPRSRRTPPLGSPGHPPPHPQTTKREPFARRAFGKKTG